MRAICLYLHIHQPIRYSEYSFFDISNSSNYYNGDYNGNQTSAFLEKSPKKATNPCWNFWKRI